MTNPYAPPTNTDAMGVEPLGAIKARVSRPATALLVMASIHSVFVAIYLVSALVMVQRGGIFFDDMVNIATGGIHFTSLILITVGAAKLGFLESYRLARMGAILACIPLITPFIVVGIPFGIWALRLLADPAVRASFPDAKARTTPTDG
jgi:hypothetical protein